MVLFNVRAMLAWFSVTTLFCLHSPSYGVEDLVGQLEKIQQKENTATDGTCETPCKVRDLYFSQMGHNSDPAVTPRELGASVLYLEHKTQT